MLRVERNVLTVPAVAVQRGPDGLYAYIVKPDQTVEMRALDVGQIDDGTAVVEHGLADGERVVTAGHYRLQPGAKVEVHEPGTTAAEG
jgi:multidrug efflux system membrane fusion protein